jgi:transcriptional regulator with XRE-family HTH domain
VAKRTALLKPRRPKPRRLWRSKLYIRQYREARNVNQAELAKAIGKSGGLISQIESGQSAASPQTLEDIAAFFRLAHVGLLFEPPVPKGWRRLVHIVPENNH